MRSFCFITSIVLVWVTTPAWSRTQEHEHQPSEPGAVLHAPKAIQAEHAQLHADLDVAIKAGGKTAEAAKALQRVLQPHFEAEEAFAMPLLSLLQPLSRVGADNRAGLSQVEVEAALKMSGMLRSKYDQMLREHLEISQRLQALAANAAQEKKPEQASFAKRLLLHAQNEEQVLYPAALLVGDCLQQQRSGAAGAAPGIRK